MPNLQNSFVQFTDQKMSEIVQKTKVELFMNSNTKRYQI